jgi:hypothetical protein
VIEVPGGGSYDVHPRIREVGVTQDPGAREAGESERPPSIAHEDIVKRLLDYQRHLRDETTGVAGPDRPPAREDAAAESAASSTSVAVETPMPTIAEVVIPESEAPMETTAPTDTDSRDDPAPSDEPPRRRSDLPTATAAAALELVAELRRRFQDLAIEADERLSTLEAFLKDSAGRTEL